MYYRYEIKKALDWLAQVFEGSRIEDIDDNMLDEALKQAVNNKFSNYPVTHIDSIESPIS